MCLCNPAIRTPFCYNCKKVKVKPQEEPLSGMVCNCGKPVRYARIVEGNEEWSCNKYGSCPTYEYLLEENRQLKIKFKEALEHAKDIYMFREGTAPYEESVCKLRYFWNEQEKLNASIDY